MLQKMEWKKYWHRGAVLLVLLLLLSAGRAVYAQTEPVLTDYAASVQVDLDADAQGTDLPQYVENGQSLFFKLQIQNFKSQELIAFLKDNPNTDFTIPLDFIGHITGNYPAEIEPDDFDNVAVSNDKPLFRWWIDKDSDVIRIRFDEEWIEKADNNTVVENVTLSFAGTLNVTDKGDDGKIEFNAAGETFPLQMKAGYTLNKTAGVPYYSTDAGSYLADYNVVLTLDQNMSISDAANADLYTAALALVDTVEAAGALQGEIYGGVIVTSPDGETAGADLVNNGTTNTLTISSPDQILQKGTYTFTYKMKIRPEAAADKLAGYTDAQKTNIVELKENGASLTTPLTATATIAWNNVTEDRFKIDKAAFTDQGSNYGGVYTDGTNEKYYIDYRVVVYIREAVTTFTVTDAPQSGFVFRSDKPITLEGVDSSANYWTNDINTAVLSQVDADVNNELQQLPLGDNGATVDCQVITITAPAGQTLAPGAYHLRIPADVTESVINANGQIEPKTFSNVAYLTSVDGEPTKEYKEYEQTIPNYTTPSKAGGYEVDPNTGEFLFYNGKPVIRWDVWVGWDFYNEINFTDTMTGMELLVNSEYPFDIHSFTDGDTHKENLVSLSSIADTNYLDFNDTNTGFTFNTKNLATNADGTPVKLYKLVYFTTPLDDNSTIGYQSTGLKNGYTVTYTDPFGNSTGVGPAEAEPTTTAKARLYVKKAHVIEINDYLTKWKITCDNTENKVPFARLDNLAIIDHIPQGQTIGEVTIHYNDAWPITVEMVCGNDQKVMLVEGTHYTIEKQHAELDLGENGKYGFAVVLNMEKVAEVLAGAGSDYFKTIDVTCYLENEKHAPGQNYRIKNDGWIYYSNQGQTLVEGINAYYDRGYATKEKLAPAYGDYYDPAAGRNFTVCSVDGRTAQSFTGGYDDNPNNGDGEEEILWKIYLGAREFGTSADPITVTVTDTLSDNQEFPTYSGKELKDLFLIESEDNPGYIIIPDSVSLSGNTFTLTFTIPGNGWAGGNKDKSKDLYITYHTVLKKEVIQDALDAAAKDADTIVVEYSNTASVSWNGDSSTMPTSTGSHGFSGSMLDKEALFLQSSGSKVNYTIEMNPYGLDLADGDVILLEDNMGDGKNVFVYIDSSFKVVNLDTGAKLEPSSAASATTYVLKMKEDGKGFTLDVPDNTPLKLTYQVKTTQPVGTKDVTLINNASLAGRKPQEKTITFDVTSAYQSGSFTIASNEVGIRLMKISSEGADSDSPIFLPGAHFVVTELDPSTFEQIGNVQNLYTDDNGVIEFKQALDSIKIYTFREQTAPSGYRLDAVPWQWCYVMLPNGGTISDSELARLRTATGMEVTVIPAGSYVEESITNTPKPGSVQFSGTKTIDGRNMTANDVFTFEITENGTNNKWVVQNDGTGTIDYPEIEYTSADVGEHVYLIRETATNISGVSTDTTTYTVTVVVSDNGDGTLTVRTSGDDYTKLDFVNKYEATGSVQFEGTKTLTGATLSANTFTFEIKDDAGKTLSTAKNGADGKIVFDKLTYTLADVGTHTYTVKEVNDGKAGYTYDTTEYEIVVTVADAGDGTLNVTYTVNGTANGAITFANEYTATGSVQFEGTKTLTGATLAANQFSFTLTGEGVNETVTNDADGKISFSAISYTLADVGTHTYTVKEVNDGKTGYTYDTTEYEIVVTVADAGDGTLNVTYTVNGTANGAITFANEYTATGSVQFGGTKTLTGATLAANQFSFTLTGEGVNETVTNDANGKISFSAINYTLADVGTHTYTVKELNDGKTGYTYDTTEYEIVVTVSDAGDGTLNVTYTVNGTANGAITFTNEYAAAGGVQFEGIKTLTGSELKEGQFSFTLTGEGVNETVTNDADGKFRFAAIAYTLADVGTHTYTVKEVNDGKSGYTYDMTVYEIVVTVADAGDGTLTVTYTVNGTANGTITFANEYIAGGSTPTPTPTPTPAPTSTPTPTPIPLNDIPKTGDESHVELWLILMIVSGIGCLMILQRRKED